MRTFDDVIRQINEEIETREIQRDWLLSNRAALESAGVVAAPCGLYLDIDNPTREQALAVIKAIPGDWEKSEGGAPATINYTLQVGDLMWVRLYSSPPPPNCKIVEEDVLVPAVPARIERVRKLVCKEAE